MLLPLLNTNIIYFLQNIVNLSSILRVSVYLRIRQIVLFFNYNTLYPSNDVEMNKNRPICLFLSYSLHFNFVPIRRKPIKVIRKIHERAQFHNDIRDLSREEKICD